MSVLRRLRRRPVEHDPAAWFALFSLDADARARAMAAVTRKG